ncbi:helix-turn-helix domain-containing protein [Chryseobacterium sp. BIGb0232]|uniref:helix-turn-helix domain-containing protein n=1 Tax=Chryseobacterium sp. BIGb0232 TaxID=2940598 RepID=UPI000F494B62|nr:helix-turn-helix domain-containing protein [Chryseobacterium sp. BIGb0232]
MLENYSSNHPLDNQYTGKHFFDFINEFRINNAKTPLKEQAQLTVLEVVYKVGFNSKSSCYTTFKKETNVMLIYYT